MKRYNERTPAMAAVVAWWLGHVLDPARALQYGCAAHRDERNGFRYAAAMEWRKAAELLPANTLGAEYSWRQWERIMRLPRRLAGPVGVSRQRILCVPPASVSPSAMALNSEQTLFANAA